MAGQVTGAEAPGDPAARLADAMAAAIPSGGVSGGTVALVHATDAPGRELASCAARWIKV